MKTADRIPMQNQTIPNSKRKNDILLITGLLVILALAALFLFLFRQNGDTVTVTIDGVVHGEYRLSENREVEIRTAAGYNILVIENGAAFIREASCPDGICVSHRPVSYGGESIICLPNKVVVEVQAQNADQPDIIS